MTRGYFAGRAQVRNADGQDFAQMRAGVKLHKAIMAAIAHPSMAHRFDGTGVAILEVRMARDFKLAHVRWTVHDDGDSRAAAHALRRNAAALKTMAGKMLGSKHTPRLEFIDDGATSRKEAELAEAFELAEARRLDTEAHVERLARRDAETRRMKAAGSYRPGAYEHLLDDEHAHDDDDDTAGDIDVAPVVCGLSSEPKKKGRCCVVGCNARWDRWSSMGDFRMMYQKHYCGLCQRAYCQAHTRVSPHGTKGRCDPESKCYCAVCWDDLNAATREALEATNRLPRREPTSGSATPDSRKRAKTRWRSVLNYKLRTPSRAENLNLMDEDLDGE